MHHFPPLSKSEMHQQWLVVLNLKSEDVKSHDCVCNHHFRNGDTRNRPSLNLGKTFHSPKKMLTPCGLQANKWQKLSMSPPIASTTPSPNCVVSTPVSSGVTDSDLIPECEQMITSESEPLISDFSIHEIPNQPGTLWQQIHSPSDEALLVIQTMKAGASVLSNQ